MATNQEDIDFTFPATTYPQQRFIGSPPLWQTTTNSPASYPGTPTRRRQDHGSDTKEERDKDKDKDKSCASIYLHQRRSFSQIEDVKKLMSDLVDVEEKMDMLWEDFNEEFSSRKLKSRSSDTCSSSNGKGKGKGMVNIGCVKLSKSRNSNNKPTLLVFMKVLKNFFLLQNSHRSIKKTTHW